MAGGRSKREAARDAREEFRSAPGPIDLVQRHRAWLALQGMRRQAELLPFPDENVGALVGRLDGPLLFMGSPCTLTVANDASDARLGLGRNDHRHV